MKITLTNGNELTPIIVIGGNKYIQRESRDALTFVFPSSQGLTYIDEMFTPKNCESIVITDDESNTYIHKGYTIRSEITLKSVMVSEPTDTTDAVYEDRIFVTMGQRTDLENMIAEQSAALNALATGEG